jgi:hypothetical protein
MRSIYLNFLKASNILAGCLLPLFFQAMTLNRVMGEKMPILIQEVNVGFHIVAEVTRTEKDISQLLSIKGSSRPCLLEK